MNEDFYITLIYKKLSGEISPAEQRQLEAWIAQSKDNQRTAASVEKAWNASDLLQAQVDDIDLDAEFGALEALLEEEEAELPTPAKEATIRPLERQASPRRNWLAIAASVLMIVAAGFLLRNAMSGGTDTPQWAKVVTQDEGKSVQLPDGSTVYLNKQSALSYFTEMTGEKREVKLQGEAFFEVEHNAARPFEVATSGETISVLGTSFNVKTSDTGRTSVYVATGKVGVVQVGSTENMVLEKGEQGISNSANKELKHLGKQSGNVLAWHTRQLEFDVTPLSEVLPQIEQLYNVKLVLENKELNSCPFDASFDKEGLDDVLDVLETILSAEVERVGNTYTIKGGAC